jgi:hypothetical protein
MKTIYDSETGKNVEVIKEWPEGLHSKSLIRTDKGYDLRWWSGDTPLSFDEAVEAAHAIIERESLKPGK